MWIPSSPKQITDVPAWKRRGTATCFNVQTHEGVNRDPVTPRIGGLADTSIVFGQLQVLGWTRGGEAVVGNFFDDDYMAQVDGTPGVGGDCKIWFRYKDANHGYRFDVVAKNPGWNSHVYSVVDGKATLLSSAGFGSSSTIAVKIKVSGTSIKVWRCTTLVHNLTDSTHAAGTVAFSGDLSPKFDILKIPFGAGP